MSHTGGLRQPCQRRIPEASGGFVNVCRIPEASGGFVHVYSSCCNARKVVDIDSNSDIDIDICFAFREASEALGRRLGGLSCGPGGLRGAPRRGPEGVWGPLGGVLGASWGALGGDARRSEREVVLGGVLGPPSGRLGPLLGPSWGHLGAILGPSWGLLGPSWGHLGPSCALLGPSWRQFGRLKSESDGVRKTYKNLRFFNVFGALGGSKMGPSWAKLGSSCDPEPS